MMLLLGEGHQHRVGDLGGGSRGRSDAGGGDALVGDCLLGSVHRDGDGQGREKGSSHYGWNSRSANEPRQWKNFSNIIVWNINNIALFRKSIILLQI
ncbi:hypothetical protein D8674_005635 [Pyrus ussuriensis x Pyrus communis]|uniref:Uncharacterized protein n=1 Tax=Pyrus ussuriensis x Pyrus communis TaxID=2448454 RepID=A0A5N5FS03_9ROSA|nr:hypothetical protein D8674_005635 [Pyrus ussuriensis x Pyrus communis]